MARTTRKDVERAVELLATVLDMDALAKRYGPGKLALDYYNPGDNPRAYKVVWILDENGAQYEPFGTFRRRAEEMVDTIHFLTNAHYAGVLKRNGG
jgi:hypothetical protein